MLEPLVSNESERQRFAAVGKALADPKRLCVLESLAAGMSIAEIVDAYPSLTEESVRGVLAELAHRLDLQPA